MNITRQSQKTPAAPAISAFETAREAMENQRATESKRLAAETDDRMWMRGLRGPVIRWTFFRMRGPIGTFSHTIVTSAHLRGIIDSDQCQAMLAIIDRRLYPERH